MADDKKEQRYLEIRQESINRKYESQSQFDKYLLTLSSASLGFSIAFIKDIRFIEQHNNWIIVLSWVFFVLSSALTLFSFKTSVQAFDKQIQDIDDIYAGKKSAENPTASNKATKVFNVLNIVFFIIGIILTFIYICTNLKQDVNMPEEKQEQQSGNLSEGALPTNLSNSIIQQLIPEDREIVEIRKGLEITPLPMVNLSPIITEDNSTNSETNKES